jgi:hypothetical protein
VGEEEIAIERDTRINKITNNSIPKAQEPLKFIGNLNLNNNHMKKIEPHKRINMIP